MLQNIGDILKGQRWLAFLVLGLLILVFALWGTYGIVDLTFGAPKYGLKVNGEEIPDRDAAARLAGAPVAVPAADSRPTFRRPCAAKLQNQLLDQYMRETLMRQRATERGFRVSDESADRRPTRARQAFQVDGKFSRCRRQGHAGADRHEPGGIRAAAAQFAADLAARAQPAARRLPDRFRDQARLCARE